MMDEIKMERRGKERLVSLRAPNKGAMYYYTPDSYKHMLVLNCALLTAKCAAWLWVAQNTSSFEDAKERSGTGCCSLQKKTKKQTPTASSVCLCVISPSVHGAFYSNRAVIIPIMLKEQLPLKMLSSSK